MRKVFVIACLAAGLAAPSSAWATAVNQVKVIYNNGVAVTGASVYENGVYKCTTASNGICQYTTNVFGDRTFTADKYRCPDYYYSGQYVKTIYDSPPGGSNTNAVLLTLSYSTWVGC